MSDRTRRGITLSWLVLFVLSIMLQYGNLTNPSTVAGAHDVGLFELDGDASDSAATGADWEGGAEGSLDQFFVGEASEAAANDDTYFTTGGSKDENDVPAWEITSNPVPDKDELLDAYAAVYEKDGETWVYFGADRFDNDGDAQIGFWFFQNDIGIASGDFTGTHADGDVLILSEYTNGGVVDLVCAYEWDGAGGGDTLVDVPGDCDEPTNGSHLNLVAAGAECDVADGTFDICAVTNSAVATAPWPFTNKDDEHDFAVGQFFEGGINLTDMFGGQPPCFGTFLAETRSSQETDAQLKDFAFGSLDTCVPPDISTQVSSSSIVIGSGSVTDTAHLTGSQGPVTGTVDFLLCGPTISAANCDTAFPGTGIVDAGQDKAINGSGDALSNAMSPTAPGWYCFRAEYTPAEDSEYLAASHTNSTTECFEVLKASPAIVTSATQSVAAGNSISDSATLSGGVNPTGTITFNAYGPDNATCAGAAIYSTSLPVDNGNNTYGPVSFFPAVAGVYRWIASYSGDANNNPISGACNDTGETDTVTKVQPSIVTAADQTVTIGDSISDSATLSGGVSPTGSITFTAYGPGDDDCNGTPAYSVSVGVNGNGIYGPASFSPTATGTYHWIAAYSGDANNESATGACGDAGENDTVNPAVPQIITFADESVIVGAAISDSASLSGGVSPTGSITFTAYGPGDDDCNGAAAFSDSVAVNGNGIYGPASFVPSVTGTYHWIADYSGDANNEGATGACGDAGENDTVNPRTPTISTLLTDGETSGTDLTFPIGTAVTDSAALDGATDDAGGTVTYTVYTDDTCQTEFADAGTADVANAIVGDSDPITFNDAGTYYWQAVYSGDINNEGATSACTDEIVTIVPNAVTINTLLSGQGQEGSAITIQINNAATDSAVLTGETATAGGSVTYTVYSDATCETVFASGGTKAVTNGDVPNSDAVMFDQAGTFYWVASYSGDANNEPAVSGCGEEIVTVVVPSIDIVKSVNDADHIVGPGQSLTYSLELTVVNGPVTQSVVSDPLPVGQDFVSASNGGVYAAATRTITWDLGTLQTGSPTLVLTYVVTVAANAAPGNQPNTATFDTQETGPDSDDETVSVPALVVDKSYVGNTGGTAINGTGIAKVGDTLTYTLAYDLTGGPVTNGVLTDTLPNGLAYVANSATNNAQFTFVSYNPATRVLTWTAPVVSSDGSVTYRVTVLDGSFNLPQPLVNTATVDSNETNLDDDTANVLVQVVLAATATPVVTLPPTDTIDSGDQSPSNPGFGLMLALLVLAGIGLVAGYLTPTPGRIRREEVRRR